MPCYTPDPVISEESWYEQMLCCAMKYLSAHQIDSIKVDKDRIGCLEWYLEHLVRDYAEAYAPDFDEPTEKIQKEANRLGFRLYKCDIGFSYKLL